MHIILYLMTSFIFYYNNCIPTQWVANVNCDVNGSRKVLTVYLRFAIGHAKIRKILLNKPVVGIVIVVLVRWHHLRVPTVTLNCLLDVVCTMEDVAVDCKYHGLIAMDMLEAIGRYHSPAIRQYLLQVNPKIVLFDAYFFQFQKVFLHCHYHHHHYSLMLMLLHSPLKLLLKLMKLQHEKRDKRNEKMDQI